MHASWLRMSPLDKRSESSLPKDHEDHIAENAFNSIRYYNLVHKFFRCLKRWKFRMRKLQILSSKKNARKKLELRVESAIPCQGQKPSAQGKRCGKEPDTRRSRYACIVETHESTTKRLERTLPKDHEDPFAVKGFNSLSQYSIVHKFITMLEAMQIPDAKAAVGK